MCAGSFVQGVMPGRDLDACKPMASRPALPVVGHHPGHHAAFQLTKLASAMYTRTLTHGLGDSLLD